MKKNILLLLSLAALSVSAIAAPSGQIFFITDNGTHGNPVFDVSSNPLGTGFYGQLYVGVDAAHLQAVGPGPVQFNTGGANAGFIADSSSGVNWSQVVNSTTLPVGGQSGGYVLRAWSGTTGSTFESASVTVGAQVGSSAFTSIAAFGGNDTTGAPTANFPFSNLHSSFTLSTVSAVPEPTTLALGLFGAAGLLIRRRK